MPWVQNDVMSQKLEFIYLARAGQFRFRNLCRRFNVSRPTGYKWLKRFNKGSEVDSLENRTKKPKHSPNRILRKAEEAIVKLRTQYPQWGAKKIVVLLKEQYPHLKSPSVRTINRVLKRKNLLSEDSPSGRPFKRFEYPSPNQLWQMDFKGDFLVMPKTKCYPLTVLDDHSRFNLTLDPHTGTSGLLVKKSLTNTFREYGLPERILADRGAAWYAPKDIKFNWTYLGVWIMRLGINLIHSSAWHPQTLGKDERFHRTLKNEAIKGHLFESLDEVIEDFKEFRYRYNHIRPHEGIGFKRPIERYHPSSRAFPEKMPEIQYPTQGGKVRTLGNHGILSFKGRHWPIHNALADQRVFVKELSDKHHEVYFVNTRICTINLENQSIV